MDAAFSYRYPFTVIFYSCMNLYICFMQHILWLVAMYSRNVSKHGITVYFLICFSGLRAQETNCDSLRALLKQTSNDSIRCGLLTKLSETAPDGEWENDNQQLKTVARQAFYRSGSLSLKKFYLHCIALALNNEGVILGRMDLPPQELAHYQAAYHLFKAIADSAGMATSISNIGTKYLMIDEYERALRFFMESLAISEAIHDINGKARILMSIGEVYRKTNRTSNALEYYEKSLAMSQAIHDDWQFALTLRKIAFVYHHLYEYEKAAHYLRKSMAVCKKIGDMDGYSECLTILSVMDFRLKNYAVAEKGLLECLAINDRYGFHFRDGDLLLHLAEIKWLYQNDSAALRYLQKARTDFEKDQVLQGRILSLMSKIYLNQGKTDAALLYGKESLKLSLLHRNYENVVSTAKTLKKIYEKNRDYPKAYEVTDLMSRLNDSLFDTNRQLSAVRSQYRSEYLMKAVSDSLNVLRTKAVFESRISNEQKNRYLLILSFTILVLLAWLALQKFRQSQKLKVVALRNEIANDIHDEIGASISSIKLSAGFGSRSASPQEQEHVLKNIEQTSLEIARSISDIIWSIKPGNDDFILMLDKMQRFGQELCRHAGTAFSFRYNQIEADPIFTYMERKHIYLIYREALNNAVKHSGAQQISTLVSFHDKVFKLKISDNGCGFDTTKTTVGNGRLSMMERAKELGGTLQISSERGLSTDVILECRITRSTRPSSA